MWWRRHRWFLWLLLLGYDLIALVVYVVLGIWALVWWPILLGVVLLVGLVWAVGHPLPLDGPTAFRRAGKAYGHWAAKRQR
jgi:hypothetical protein